MKVSIYLSHPDSPAPGWVDMLARSLGEDVETVHGFRIPAEPPSLIHIVGLGSHTAPLLRTARRRGIPTLLSPVADLLPWQRSRHAPLLSLASALHVTSRIAEETVATLVPDTMERRLIACADTTRTTTPEEMAGQMRAYYQDIVDGAAATIILRPDMSQTLDTLYALLQAALEPKRIEDKAFADRLRGLTAGRTADEWRCLHLYAEAQGVAEYVQAALDKNSVHPALRPEETPPVERMADDIAGLYREWRARQDRLAHYAEVYVMLRHADCDEDALARLLYRRIGRGQTGRLMERIARVTGLTEGYIPGP